MVVAGSSPRAWAMASRNPCSIDRPSSVRSSSSSRLSLTSSLIVVRLLQLLHELPEQPLLALGQVLTVCLAVGRHHVGPAPAHHGVVDCSPAPALAPPGHAKADLAQARQAGNHVADRRGFGNGALDSL